MTNKILKDEILNEEQLDNVAGGNNPFDELPKPTEPIQPIKYDPFPRPYPPEPAPEPYLPDVKIFEAAR